MPDTVVLQTSLSRWPVRRGKVRDIYDLGGELLLVSTDRISAFDWVLPTGIPDKGRVLTQLSALLVRPARRAESDALGRRRRHAGPVGRRPPVARRPDHVGPSGPGRADRMRGARLSGRIGLGRISPVGHGLRHSAARRPGRKLRPARADFHAGHQGGNRATTRTSASTRWPIAWVAELAEQLRDRSLAVYLRGAEHARERGILIADTKFEWGWWNDELILIDEVLTPDSSRFWAADRYQPGQSPPSFDKQFVRDWLSSVGWDKNSPPPPLPDDIVRKTREKYVEAYERLSGRQFAWK